MTTLQARHWIPNRKYTITITIEWLVNSCVCDDCIMWWSHCRYHHRRLSDDNHHFSYLPLSSFSREILFISFFGDLIGQRERWKILFGLKKKKKNTESTRGINIEYKYLFIYLEITHSKSDLIKKYFLKEIVKSLFYLQFRSILCYSLI